VLFNRFYQPDIDAEASTWRRAPAVGLVGAAAAGALAGHPVGPRPCSLAHGGVHTGSTRSRRRWPAPTRAGRVGAAAHGPGSSRNPRGVGPVDGGARVRVARADARQHELLRCPDPAAFERANYTRSCRPGGVSAPARGSRPSTVRASRAPSRGGSSLAAGADHRPRLRSSGAGHRVVRFPASHGEPARSRGDGAPGQQASIRDWARARTSRGSRRTRPAGRRQWRGGGHRRNDHSRDTRRGDARWPQRAATAHHPGTRTARPADRGSADGGELAVPSRFSKRCCRNNRARCSRVFTFASETPTPAPPPVSTASISRRKTITRYCGATPSGPAAAVAEVAR